MPRSCLLHIIALAVLISAMIVSAECPCTTVNNLAVQWSSLIVQAKLLAIGAPIDMHASPSTMPGAADASSAFQYQLDDFQITQVLDGKAKSGDRLEIVRFMQAGSSAETLCGEELTAAQAGKSYVLLLRPNGDLDWSRMPGQSDPRPADLKKGNPYSVMNIDSSDDLGADGIASIKDTITDARRADAGFTQDDARTQAHILATASDETESGDARESLMDMGPKAIPSIRAELSASGNQDVQRTALEATLRALSPPPLSPKEGAAK
jgi:hypothetical protein